MAKPKKHVSPRLINAMMVGITRRNTESRRISECDEYQAQAWGNDEIDAQMMTDESMHQENLFGRPDVQEALELREAIRKQDDARDQHAEEPNVVLEEYSDDGALDEDDKYHESVESECSIVDETIQPSPMKMRTRSKARRTLVIPEPDICSDVEDDEPRPRQRKRNPVTKTPLRAGGTSKYFRRNSNQFPSIASKTLAARRSRVGNKGTK